MKAFRIGFIALLLLAFLFVAANFTAQNGEPVTITLFDWVSRAYPKWQVILAALFVGALCATLFFIIELIVLETRVIRLRRANQKLERSLVALQPSRPLVDSRMGSGPLSTEPSLKIEDV